jgi:hypothetical protein
MIGFLRVVIGSAVLLGGRKLYWLFVGAAGFALGISLTSRLMQGQPTWVMILIALAAGLAGTLLALFLQRLAIGVAGFISGGYLAASVLNALAEDTSMSVGNWLIVFAGGIVGAILVGVLFDWALIVLSSLTGAGLIVQSFDLRPLLALLLFAVLLAAGIVFQIRWMGRERKKRR